MSTLVIVLDLDGTIIGDIRYQLQTYELLKTVQKPARHLDLASRLKNGLIRPGFDRFVQEMKNQNIELFVYTASEKTWALQVIGVIEKVYNFRFNRPIFTRNDCTYVENENVLKKNLRCIKPMITRSLKKRYPNISLDNRMMMIDNSNVFYPEDVDCVLKCRTYNFRYPENIPCFIDCDTYVKHKDRIHEQFKFPHTPTSYHDFQRMFYTSYVHLLGTVGHENNKEHMDRFWYNLGNIIVQKHIKVFSPKVVAYLNRKCGH